MTDTPEAVRLASRLLVNGLDADEEQVVASLLRRIPEIETARDVAVELAAQYAAERDQLRAELEKVRVLYTQPAAGADVLDAERWRYAMDWDTSAFAVCRRVGATGTCWEPIKTDGPIDAAIADQKGQ